MWRVALGPNTSHSMPGHPCAGASGLQGPDDLSPPRTPLSESGFAAGAANDRVAFGERRRFGCSHIFYVFGLKLSESGNWSRSGCNMWGREHLVVRTVAVVGVVEVLGGNFQNWVRLEITGGTSYVMRGKISENR